MMSSTDSRAQSLMLSSHIFLGVLRILFISIVLCNNPLEMLLCLQMWPYRNHFLFFIPCRSGYWEPAKSLYCMQHFFFLMLSVSDVQDSPNPLHVKGVYYTLCSLRSVSAFRAQPQLYVNSQSHIHDARPAH